MENTKTKSIPIDGDLIGKCGLYCGSCSKFLTGKCAGCEQNAKATWCKVRECCKQSDYKSCADCELTELQDCKKFNNFMSKLFGVLYNSDRSACIERLKELGYEPFAAEMAQNKTHTIKKN